MGVKHERSALTQRRVTLMMQPNSLCLYGPNTVDGNSNALVVELGAWDESVHGWKHSWGQNKI